MLSGCEIERKAIIETTLIPQSMNQKERRKNDCKEKEY